MNVLLVRAAAIRDNRERQASEALPLNVHADNPDGNGIREALARRLGGLHARQRLGIEEDNEARVFGQGINFFHPENFYSAHAAIAFLLKASGLYWRGKRNARNIELRRNSFISSELPPAFDGFAILHLSDLHVDTNAEAMGRLTDLLQGLRYDIAVMTGDFRGRTFGPYEETLDGLSRIRDALRGEVFAVLGNHDTIRMVPGMEAMGIRLLLNEAVALERCGQRVHLVGVDDAHYFRADNIEKAASHIPQDEFSVFLSHTPEIYRQAAHADFNVMLSGHTHGGQICLPGSFPITLDSVLPRSMGAGAWKYRNMQGYTSAGAGTSIVPVRLNCPPEITIHELRRAAGQ